MNELWVKLYGIVWDFHTITTTKFSSHFWFHWSRILGVVGYWCCDSKVKPHLLYPIFFSFLLNQPVSFLLLCRKKIITQKWAFFGFVLVFIILKTHFKCFFHTFEVLLNIFLKYIKKITLQCHFAKKL
jgi:hypothetical protein